MLFIGKPRPFANILASTTPTTGQLIIEEVTTAAPTPPSSRRPRPVFSRPRPVFNRPDSPQESLLMKQTDKCRSWYFLYDGNSEYVVYEVRMLHVWNLF